MPAQPDRRSARYARFVVAGGIGFATDASLLFVFTTLVPLHPLLARLISIGVALFATWMFNRYLTFGPSSLSIVGEGLRYGGVGMSTAIVNYTVYAALVTAIPGMPPLVALVAASTVAMIFSYLGYSRLVFGR